MKRKKHAKHTPGTTVEPFTHPPKILKSNEKKKKLELVLKCDSAGSEEAILASLSAIQIPEIELEVIHADVGSVTKSDLLLALTASRLVLGFNVGVAPKIEQLCREQGVEVRVGIRRDHERPPGEKGWIWFQQACRAVTGEV